MGKEWLWNMLNQIIISAGMCAYDSLGWNWILFFHILQWPTTFEIKHPAKAHDFIDVWILMFFNCVWALNWSLMLDTVMPLNSFILCCAFSVATWCYEKNVCPAIWRWVWWCEGCLQAPWWQETRTLVFLACSWTILLAHEQGHNKTSRLTSK